MRKLLLIVLALSSTFTYASESTSVSSSTSARSEVMQVISGVVTDENGDPLPGTNIILEGSTLAAGTNSKGEYKFELRSLEERVMHVSFVGYTTQDIAVAAQKNSVINVSMETSPYDIENVVITTGSRVAKPLKDSPVITRVISTERIEQINPSDITTLLQYELPGLQISYNSMSKLQEISYQGMDSEYLVFLLDGERIAGEGADHNIDFNRINVDDIERIEVIRGAASTLYGSNALGGVINIITKSANRPFTANISGRYAGSDGQNYNASVGTKQNRFSSYTSLSYRTKDSYTVEDSEGQVTTTIDADGNESTSESSTTSTTVLGYTAYDASQKFGYSFTDKFSAAIKGSYYHNQRSLIEGEKNYDIYKDIMINPTMKYLINKDHQINFSYTYDQYDKDEDYFEAGFTTNIYRNTIHIARLNYAGNFTKHQFAAGVEFENEHLKHYMMADSGSVARTSISLYAQDDYKFSDKFNVVAGVRADYEDKYDVNVTPKVSAMYRPSDAFTFRANFAKGFRTPSLKELYQEYDMGGMGWFYIYGNEDLEPEKSTQYSLSGEYNYKGLNASVSAYHNRFKGKIAYTSTADGLNYEYVNADDAKTTGVEAIVRYRIASGWSLMGSYAYVDDYEEVDGYNISTVRPHSITFNCAYTHKFGKVTTTAAFNGRWNSAMDVYSRSTDDDGNYYYTYSTYDQRTICSLNLSAQFPRGINVGFMLDNLFNYVDSAYQSGVQTPVNGLSCVFTLSINIADLFKL